MAARPIRRACELLLLAGALNACGGEQPFDLPDRDPGEQAPHVASIGGFVRDRLTSQPIAGAVVGAAGTTAVSKADGSYELRDLRDAVVQLSTSKEGYETMSTLYPLASGHNTLTILLLPTVSINASPP